MLDFFRVAHELLQRVEETQHEAIAQATRLLAASLLDEGV